jgi:MEMO1 family protein
MNYVKDLDQPSVRPAAVAGQFYPDDPEELKAEVNRYLAEAKAPEGAAPKAIIAPHAGYMYSGPIAGTVFACLGRAREQLRRIVLIGPSHCAAFPGLAASTAKAFATPLGLVPVDEDSLAQVRSLPQVKPRDAAHRHEHCLEVQLPFLQTLLGRFTLVPLLVGDATDAEVSDVLDVLWGGAETGLVISSDLSHYHDYRTARQLDRATASSIEAMEEEELRGDQACGCRPIRGLLHAAKKHGLRCQLVDLRNSGDTSGRRDRVVGYGGFIFTPATRPPQSPR